MSETAPSGASSQTPPTAEISVGTDAAYAPANGHTRRALRNISEVRHFFRTNEVPIYFVGATPFNLLGLDRRVRNLFHVTYYDGWDGAHPRVHPQAQAVRRIRIRRVDQQLFVNDFCVLHGLYIGGGASGAGARKRLAQQYPPGRPCGPGFLRIVGTRPSDWTGDLHPTRTSR